LIVETTARVDPRDHVVLFYDNTEQLVTMVAEFVVGGFSANETAVVVATAEHLVAFDDAMVAAGIEVEAARADRRLLMIDASEAMSRFLKGGDWPVADRFDTEIGGLIRQLSDSGHRLRVYGEMVALLWDDGHVAAAIELEALWNELGLHVPFSLFCAYPAASVTADDDSFQRLCHCHSAVVSGQQLEATRAFSGESTALSHAREFVVDTLGSWDLACIAGDASLVVSELATNAILHARSDFVVAVSLQGDTVRISVRDASSQLPVVRDPSPATISGRGLILVNALGTSWGAESFTEGKEVWVELGV
jgi:MEDS: MEthanogen/methylotroph, DcmR Sensory domain